MKERLAQDFDAGFVGSGAPRGRDLDRPGRREGAANIHVGLDWLANVYFGHVTTVGKRVLVLRGGNTAMDCCRSARRLAGSDVTVLVRSGLDQLTARPWEKDDPMPGAIPIPHFPVHKAFVNARGRPHAMPFYRVHPAPNTPRRTNT